MLKYRDFLTEKKAPDFQIFFNQGNGQIGTMDYVGDLAGAKVAAKEWLDQWMAGNRAQSLPLWATFFPQTSEDPDELFAARIKFKAGKWEGL